MNYDFKSTVDRRNTGSVKWEQMYSWKKDVANDVVPLSVADMEFVSPPEIVDGLKAFLDEQVLGYAMPYDAYLNSVVDWQMRRHGFEIQKEWVVNTPGVVLAVLAAIKAFTEEGGGVILFKPIYYPFTNMIDLANRKEVNVPLIDNDGRYEIDFEGFAKEAAKAENKLLIMCSPHNPSGRVWTREELEKVDKIASENNLIVLADEIWNDIVMPGYEHIGYATVSDYSHQNSIVCTAPSKTFNIAGIKASNIIVPNEKIRTAFADELDKMHSSSLNILAYKACEIAYTKSEAWADELITVIAANHKLVKDYFEKNHPEIKVYHSEGTYLSWLDFRGLGMDHLELEKFLHEEAEFYTDEGYIFGDEGKGFERLNIACPAHVLETQLKKLSAALNARK